MAGAHPEVLEALVRTNSLQTAGYGEDSFCAEAKLLIRKIFEAPDSDVYFFEGGTQTNLTAIDGMLCPYQAVIATELAHINVHEAGAIEACGHKVITLPHHLGKIVPADLEEYMRKYTADETRLHIAEPGMVYISFPTEIGTVYSRQELESIRDICSQYNMFLYIDGARLGYGLSAESCDIEIPDIARFADAFYIGGTKQGALFGEALVTGKGLIRNFFTQMKLHGAVLAKGRVLGVQFSALFKDNLYFRISRQAVDLAIRLRKAFEEHGYTPLFPSDTNQQFFTLPNVLIDRLREQMQFDYWGPRGIKESHVRFVTGWETTASDIAQLEKALDNELGTK